VLGSVVALAAIFGEMVLAAYCSMYLEAYDEATKPNRTAAGTCAPASMMPSVPIRAKGEGNAEVIRSELALRRSLTALGVGAEAEERVPAAVGAPGSLVSQGLVGGDLGVRPWRGRWVGLPPPPRALASCPFLQEEIRELDHSLPSLTLSLNGPWNIYQ
jgi:hypothetical protein